MMSIYATRKWRICLKSAEGHWANTEAMAHCLTMFSVAKFSTSEVRLNRHWNGSTTERIWWVAADKHSKFEPGSNILCARFEKHSSSLMFLARLCYIFGGSEIYRLPSAFLSTDIERGNVFGQNPLRRRNIQTETACRPDLSTFKGWCATFADE